MESELMASGEKIIGTGIDLVETDRIGKMISRWDSTFRDRVFLPAEREYCETKAVPAQHYAGRFAVKEALVKALGTGIGEHATWLDVEVCRDSGTGAPSVALTGRAAATAERLGVSGLHVSLSHTRHYAVAHVILTGER
jgi:holo-[acyl-carrier protein] synthase